jgi:putative transcriptional regulator
MKSTDFDKLVKGLTEAGEIIRGERAPARETVVDATMVKDIRKKTGLSQRKFALLLSIEPSTLQNWEQGRREPQGPAKALLRAIKKDPKNVLRALAS